MVCGLDWLWWLFIFWFCIFNRSGPACPSLSCEITDSSPLHTFCHLYPKIRNLISNPSFHSMVEDKLQTLVHPSTPMDPETGKKFCLLLFSHRGRDLKKKNRKLITICRWNNGKFSSLQWREEGKIQVIICTDWESGFKVNWIDKKNWLNIQNFLQTQKLKRNNSKC